jgi:serine/threonine protein kinase
MVAAVPVSDKAASIQWDHGISGVVVEAPDLTVIKRPFPGEASEAQLEIERRIYERLGQHPYITKFIAAHPNEIVLERLQYPLRKRLLELRRANERPAIQTILRWARQIAQAFRHVHSCGVLQVDIGTYNVLLDWNEDVKLCDFAGSSLDGSEPTVAPSAHSTHPRISITHPSIRSELFAVGSMLYEMETTYEPYNDKNDGELEELFDADHYPEVGNLTLGEVIIKCWTGQYVDASEIVMDIGQIEKHLKDSIP